MPDLVDVGLLAIFVVVLLGPFLWKRVEENLEVFLFIMGAAAVSVASVWSLGLVEDALVEPILKGIVPAVLLAGAVFHYGRPRIARGMRSLLRRYSLKWIVFMMVVVLGLVSSVITAIIAALLLVELVHVMPLDRRTRAEVVIIACFSIGLGAALTPLGEPLSTIAITKLQDAPYHADFFFLFRHLAVYIIPGVVVFGIIATIFVEGKHKKYFDPVTMVEEARRSRMLSRWERRRLARRRERKRAGKKERPVFPLVVEDLAKETVRDVLVRGVKVYIFVMALILLGGGMKLLIDRYFIQVPAEGLYWVNMLSAVLDNATLTAAEIGPSLSLVQIKSALMALLISGGMLIPGNIPNIISAHKLKISSKEWARLGVPLGLGAMLVYFVWLYLVPFP